MKGIDQFMLKNLGYDGVYHDQNLSVSVLLENPLDFGLKPAMMVFSVTVKDKRDPMANLNIEDFTFYILDEQNRIYNMQKVIGLQPNVEIAAKDDEPIRRPDALILTEFKHEFLFQDLRMVFCCKPYPQFHIIQLQR